MVQFSVGYLSLACHDVALGTGRKSGTCLFDVWSVFLYPWDGESKVSVGFGVVLWIESVLLCGNLAYCSFFAYLSDQLWITVQKASH